jgi:hypothetical protein
MQFKEAFYHETALVHRPSGTNEIIDIIDSETSQFSLEAVFDSI